MTSPPNLRRFTVTETREAVEVTADNLDEVAAWCGGTTFRVGRVEGIEYRVRIARKRVHIGDLVVTDGSRWWDVTRDEFERASEQWTEKTK